MNEELLKDEAEQKEVEDGIDYIEAIKEMKKKSVSLEAFEKVKKENKQLLAALVQGKEIEIKKEEKADIGQLRKELYNSEKQLSNLEYVSKTLQLRDALIEQGERDPFLPYGEKISITADQIEKAEAVAKVLKECVEFADGDSGIFSAELQRRTKDMPIYGKR